MKVISTIDEFMRVLDSGFYTIEQAMQVLNCSQATVYRRCMKWPDVITVTLNLDGSRNKQIRLIPKKHIGGNLDFQAAIALSKALKAITNQKSTKPPWEE